MPFSRGFLRLSRGGKHVGVLKYKDPWGQWRQVTKTFTEDRAESERMMEEWRAVMEAAPRGDGGPGAGARGGAGGAADTVEQAVRALLGAQLARGRIERSTYDTQVAYGERDLFPELGGVPLAELTAGSVQRWSDSLCARMSPGSARVPFAVLSKTLAAAARDGSVGRNPLDAVEGPARSRPARAWLPPESAAALERAAAEQWGRGDPRTAAVALALHAGLRAGECCALRWRDVGEGAGSLRVAASVGRTRGGTYLKAPKTPASAREMPVTSALSGALAARREAVGSPAGHRFVCSDGPAHLDPRRLSRDFAALCGRAGVVDSEGRRATFHELRHTFATRAVLAGVDARTLADMLGHASADVTLNVYAASSSGAMAAAVARMEAALGGPPG